MPVLNKINVNINQNSCPVSIGELWTSKQRQMHPIHYTISYRASFKPELPDFFINKFLKKNNKEINLSNEQIILDPFGGRGTTIIQANLLGYKGIHNDLSPVSIFLAKARNKISKIENLTKKIWELDLTKKIKLSAKEKNELLPFFHEKTLNEIANLKNIYLNRKKNDHELDYIVLTALSRLHGHSDGFLSVYSFPQISILPSAQIKNNLRLGQTPVYKSIKERIIKKMSSDLSKPLPRHYHLFSKNNLYIKNDSRT